MMTLRELAPAKLNLFLHVTGRRADGYHLLQSLVAFADMSDRLEAAPADAVSLTVTGPFAGGLGEGTNSVLAAAGALRARFGVSKGAALRLEKHLPVAAGIGGGTADAAAALRLLARLWQIEAGEREMQELAATLGADVPACLRSRTLYMEGIGEIITPGPELSGWHGLLVNPLLPLPTKDVFTAFAASKAQKTWYSSAVNKPAAFAGQGAALQFLLRQKNDLEPAARALQPAVGEVLAALEASEGCQLARMSGSGATCFALFAGEGQAAAAAAMLAQQQPGWWVKQMRLI